MTHSPEPWTIQFGNVLFDANGRDVHYGYFDHQMPPANAERIVACVNALQGIENPQEFVQEVKEVLEATKRHVAMYGSATPALVPKRPISHIANEFDPYS
jgi:hypothetical protein